MLRTLLPMVTQDTMDIYARTISTTDGVLVEMFFKQKFLLFLEKVDLH